MNKHEVLTLQVGNNANFVGSHLWNSRDIRLSSGMCEGNLLETFYHVRDNAGSRSYAPRCVCIDLNENIEHLSIGADSDVASSRSSLLWGGKVETTHRSSVALRENLTDFDLMRMGTPYWTAMLRPELHHKSLCTLPTWATNSHFDTFHKGLLKSSINEMVSAEYVEDVLDRCRYFIEACDHLHAIEVLCDGIGGFAGLTVSLLQEIREEYGNSVALPVWSVADDDFSACSGGTGVNHSNSDDRGSSGAACLDAALLYSTGLECFNSIVPLSLPDILRYAYQSAYPPAPSSELARRKVYDRYVSTGAAAAAVDLATSYYFSACDSSYSNNLSGPGASSRAKAEERMDAPDNMYGDDYAYNERRMERAGLNPAQDQTSNNSSSCSETHGRKGSTSEAGPNMATGSGFRGGINVNTANASSNESDDNSLISSAHEWCGAVTRRGRTPVCFLEATLPGFTHPLAQFTSAELAQFISDSFSDAAAVQPPRMTHSLLRCNPFTCSFSPSRGCGISPPSSSKSSGGSGGAQGNHACAGHSAVFPYPRAFSNVVCIRGIPAASRHRDVTTALFAQCLQYPYTVTACVAKAPAVLLADNSALRTFCDDSALRASHSSSSSSGDSSSGGRGGGSAAGWRGGRPIAACGLDAGALAGPAGVAAVTSSPLVGRHLSDLAALWARNVCPSRATDSFFNRGGGNSGDGFGDQEDDDEDGDEEDDGDAGTKRGGGSAVGHSSSSAGRAYALQLMKAGVEELDRVELLEHLHDLHMRYSD